MPAWLAVIVYDLKNMITSLEPVDFAQPSFVAMWVFIVMLPLIGIDRRDPIAGLVYILFCVAAGVALIFALPQKYTPTRSINTQFITVIGMAAVAAYRWFYGANNVQLEAEIKLQRQKEMELKEARKNGKKKK